MVAVNIRFEKYSRKPKNYYGRYGKRGSPIPPLFSTKEFSVAKISYNQEALAPLIEESKRLAEKVNPKAPSGRVRTKEEILTSCLAGKISEDATKSLLGHFINSYKIDGRVLPAKISPDKLIERDEFYETHVNVFVEVSGKTKDIEVRSSFPYHPNFSRVINEFLDILGYYRASYKSKEEPKDYYLRPLFHFNHNEMLKRLKEEMFLLYIVGGATKEELLRFGIDKDLDQQGARYRVISPITRGRDINQMMEAIFERKFFSSHLAKWL